MPPIGTDSRAAGLKVLTRCRCSETHTSIRKYLECAFSRANISGTGKFALISRCGLTRISLYATEDAAHAAKGELDVATCPGNCRRSHEVVQLSPNPNHPQQKTAPVISHTALRFSHL